MRHIYASIDIGSDNVKVVVCELYKGRYNLLAASSVKSKGIKRGLITNVSEASSCIDEAFKQAEAMLGFKITKVIAIVPSYFAEFTMINGEVEISNEDKQVTGEDVIKVLQLASQEAIVPSKEMVTIMPIDFVTDNGVVKDPLGVVTEKLQTRAIMVTVPKKNIYSVVGVLKNVGVDTVDISLGGIGDIYTFKTPEMDDNIGAIINIGAEVTSVSLYNKGIIVRSALINMGSHDVDSDISYMYKIDEATSCELKENFALAHKKHASTSEFRTVTNKRGETLRINQFELTEIIQARLEEILTLAHNEITNLTGKSLNYIIVSGGITNLSNFNEIVSEILGKYAIIGNVNLIGLRNNKYSEAIGNIIYFVNKLKLKGKNYSMITNDDMEVLSSPKKGNNDSVLGKFVGYFFGE